MKINGYYLGGAIFMWIHTIFYYIAELLGRLYKEYLFLISTIIAIILTGYAFQEDEE